MVALGAMLLAFAAIVGAGFSLFAGGAWGWVALALFLASMVLEGVGFALAGMEEAAEE
jgi:hypothetical protein